MACRPDVGSGAGPDGGYAKTVDRALRRTDAAVGEIAPVEVHERYREPNTTPGEAA